MSEIRTLAISIALVLATVCEVRAGSPELEMVVNLSLPDRITRQVALAAEARTRGDLVAEAAHLIEGCFAHLFLTFDATVATCARAEQAAAALPATHMLARLRAYQSTFVAWTLDWKAARALTDEAERLAAGGPAADTLAGDALRTIHLVRGSIDAEQGRYADVDRELGLYIAQSRAAGDRNGVAGGESYLCRMYRRLGRYAEAMAACDRGVATARAAGDPFILGGALWNRGSVEIDRGDPVRAAADWTEVLDLAERYTIPFLDTTVRVELAGTLVDLGRLDEVAHHIAVSEAALASGRIPAGFKFQIKWLAGMLAVARGEDRVAIEHLRVAQQSPIDAVVTNSLIEEAGARHRLGELAEAEAAYRSAITRIESARSSVSSDQHKAGFMQRQVRAYRELVAVLWDRHQAGAAVEALAVAEAARARALLDATRAADPLARTEARAEARPVIKPLDAAALQRALPPKTTLVIFVASERRLFGFALTRDRIVMAALTAAGTRDQLGARVDLYRQLLASADTPAELAGPGAALQADLLTPLIGDTPGDTLVIAADGPLHLLPFEALYREPVGFLIEHTVVTTTPSGSLLATAPAGTTHHLPVLAIASPPTGVLPPLPAGLGEVDAIRAIVAGNSLLLTGEHATEARFRASDPASFEVLHFGTHAVIDDAVPLRSALLMAPGAGGGGGDDGVESEDDGWLRASEIYRLRLDAALVVLSGCQTGAGQVSASEGPMSLARAFLYAGARNVVATLWDVEDRSAPVMAGALYRELVAGHPVGLALARAKRALIADGAPPRAWAPWVAIGPPEVQPVLAAASPRGYTWSVLLAVAGVLALGLAAALTWVARRRAHGSKPS